MKYQKIFLIVIVLGLVITPRANAQNSKLATDSDSASFYLGYFYSKQLLGSGMKLNTDAMAGGAKAAVDKTLVISDEQINQFLQKYFTGLQQAISTENLKKGQDFLAANAKKPGVVTLPNGLQYKIIKKGTGVKPNKDDNVELFYHGTLIDGTVFDSAKDRGEPVTFSVGGVIAGFSEALQLMDEGSLWEIYIPAELGYGEMAPPSSGIKPNSVLIFEINMLKVI